MDFNSVEVLSDDDILHYYDEYIEADGANQMGCTLKKWSFCEGCSNSERAGFSCSVSEGYCSTYLDTGSGVHCYVYMWGDSNYYAYRCNRCDR